MSRAHWSSRLTFVLAAAGSAIGLGNIWKFPYMTGVNGGGAFVMIYLLCIFIVGIPIFIAELYIGQNAQTNLIDAFSKTHKPKTPWVIAGWMGLVSAFLILSFYSVVGGWVLDFEFQSLMDRFSDKNEEEIKGYLGGLFGDPVRQLFWHTLFMGATIGIVIGGVKKGIEKWNKILMPALLAILALLLAQSLFLDGFGEALDFLFTPDFSKLEGKTIVEAVGQAFFTLSLGMGAMITYGSYLNKGEKLVRISFTVALMDTMIAILAGVVVFSIVFSFGLEPGGGPTLLFQTLPVLFQQMPGGYFVSVAFFLLVAFAAFTSAVSLLEIVVLYIAEKYKAGRTKVALLAGGSIWALGILSALSTNLLRETTIRGFTFFDLFDRLTSAYLMPLGGMIISLFFGWVLGPKAVEKVVGSDNELAAAGLLWTTRVLAPLGVIVFFIQSIWFSG